MASSPLETIRDFVAAFIDAWPRADADAVAAFFTHDAVYHNGPLEPVVGRADIRDAIAGFMSMGGTVDVDMVRMAVNGAVVMAERVDYFTTAERTISLPMLGIFELQDRHIAAWRDYFDLNTFTSHLPA